MYHRKRSGHTRPIPAPPRRAEQSPAGGATQSWRRAENEGEGMGRRNPLRRKERPSLGCRAVGTETMGTLGLG